MKKTILLVEDCSMMCRFLVPIFSEEYHLAAINTPFEAILWLKTNPVPDVIILDFELPEMDGIELLKHLRSRQNWLDVPVIMLSGVKNTEKRWQCLEAGANDFLSKPFHPKELALRVNLLIKKHPSNTLNTN